MLLSGAISIRRLLRRSAMTIGYGRGLPQDATGLVRLPVTGGMAGSVTPLLTMPAPVMSGVTLTSMPAGLTGLSVAAQTAGTAMDNAISAVRVAHKADVVREGG